MKTKYIFSLLFVLITGIVIGQVPNAINYQGTLRGSSGEVISNETVTLRVNLQSKNILNPVVYLSEIHLVKTNAEGLFRISIGKGSTITGAFTDVPFSSENIWMDLSSKRAGENSFTTISTSEMLAVPYAFHAKTASAVSGNFVLPYDLSSFSSGNSGNSILVDAASWLVSGNAASAPPTQYVGTSDAKDFVIKTNGIERMRILTAGSVTVNNSLNIGNDIIVQRDATIKRHIMIKRNAVVDSNATIKYSAYLNTISGSTNVFGPFNVGNISPSLLTGTLKVDKTTTLNNGLSVNNSAPTLFTGSLRVNNATDLYNSFNVNAQSPSVMTGTLRVDSNVTFKNRAFLTNGNFNSTNSSNGNLIVYGGVGIGRNLFVGGDARVSGQTSLNGQVKITDPRISERQDSGALVVTGGVGIGKELKVRGAVHLFDSLQVDKTTLIQDALIVSDSVNINATTPLNALVVDNKTDLNGFLRVNNQMTVNTTSLGSSTSDVAVNYPLHVRGGMQGIGIKVSGTKANANNFMSFWDNTSIMQGRIEGFTSSEYMNSAVYQDKLTRLEGRRNLNSVMFSIATLKALATANTLAGALASSTGCFGLGACVATPIPSLIAAASANYIAALVFVGTSEVALLNSIDDISNYNSYAGSLTGVTFESGAGDYAEYLKMADPTEVLMPGDIVGMKNGLVSKNTIGADKIMVVSLKPIVLGNTPPAGKEDEYRKVAFLGQVPVRVIGKVNAGDYILADGNNSGMGIAKSEESLTSNDLNRILGIAWESSKEGEAISKINVGIGFVNSSNAKQIETLEASITSVQSKIDDRNKKLAALIPGFKDETVKPKYRSLNSAYTAKAENKSSDNMIYFEIEKEKIERGFVMAEKELDKLNVDINKIPGFNNYKSDPAAKERLIELVQERVKVLQDEQMKMDRAASH